MPLIRFKNASYCSRLTPHVVICASGRRYLWDGANEGVASVPFRVDAQEILSQMDYEVAWDRYGVQFDAHGKEVLKMTEPSSGDPPPDEDPSESVTSRPRGRPAKRR